MAPTPVDLSELDSALVELGFGADSATASYLHGLADELGMRDNGDYKLHNVWRKGDVTVTVEQNTSPDDLGDGMHAIVTHPPCGIIDGPNGYRVAFNPTDTELVKVLVQELEAADAE